MTSFDKCKIMAAANNIGSRYFMNAAVSDDEQRGALLAIRELCDEIMAMPEDDQLNDPLTGERRRA